ncbi:MAG TPA: hypothetical protein VFZ17_15055 [Acidimicrobiia bacterium]|nr:hypothetical protein [Acidimicrobiia bacterium]
MTFDVSTLLLQWAAGGLAFCWVTTRRREVGLGYGWLLRIVFGAMAVGALFAGLGDAGTGATIRNVGAAGVALGALVALAVSYRNRGEGIAGFDPRFDLVAPAIGLVSLTGAASFVGDTYALSLARIVVGALFLGAVTDAMLLGHWYLVQPGLRRDPIREVVRIVAVLWPFEVIVWLIPTGMLSVLSGTIDDGYAGLIGWMWVIACVTTIGLVIATWQALKEPSYSAVMAATGLMYLAILTGTGMDLLPRALLS